MLTCPTTFAPPEKTAVAEDGLCDAARLMVT
jgi:hypothetical protein